MMRGLFYIAVIFSLTSFISFKNTPEKRIVGHWTSVSTGDTVFMVEDFIASGKPITFKKLTCKQQNYTWGGGCYNGIEFTSDGVFNYYTNVMCSTETSPVINSGETWAISENLITVTGVTRAFDIKLVSVDKKKLVVVFQRHP